MDIVVETFLNPGEPSSASRRVRPLAGQGFSTEMRVECSRRMRDAHPLGQKFILWVKPIEKQGGPTFLYSNHRDAWRPISDDEAAKFIAISYKKGNAAQSAN